MIRPPIVVHESERKCIVVYVMTIKEPSSSKA